MNERFIPLRIWSPEYKSKLAEQLNIHAYPTIIFASPNKRIIGKQEGFLEPERFKEQLQRVLAILP